MGEPRPSSPTFDGRCDWQLLSTRIPILRTLLNKLWPQFMKGTAATKGLGLGMFGLGAGFVGLIALVKSAGKHIGKFFKYLFAFGVRGGIASALFGPVSWSGYIVVNIIWSTNMG